ncbi:MAG: mercury transporter [Alphaproteobacteria bacterium]|nr:MAG: mercury transporter [Alphaproteobacteria bacterium]
MSETASGEQASAFDTGPEADRKAWATTGLGVLGALAMTSCCILPLALVSLGVTGVFIGSLAELYQYHWYFLAFAAATIGYGFWKAYRPVPAAACADGSCARPVNRRVMRTILWVAAAIMVVATAFPYLAPSLLNPF